MLIALKPIMNRLVPRRILGAYARRQAEAALSPAALVQRNRDGQADRLRPVDPNEALSSAADWLCRAQDQSISEDGGVARHFSLNSGWSASYPETTGYIVPTFIDLAGLLGREELLDRSRRMLDWLVSIQLENGAFQGGMISHAPVPVTFNTGQILIGLAAGARTFDHSAYRAGMMKAAEWLRDTQDADGCWRRFATPFASPGEKSYETHVSWGLLEAERVAPGNGFGDAALRQIRWAAGNIQSNGWIRDCCLSDPTQPLTHTLGYALKGLVEGYRWSNDRSLLDAALRVAAGLRGCVRDDGFLAGRWDRKWNATVSWSCLTGAVQISASFAELYRWTGNAEWRLAAEKLLGFVRSTMLVEGPDEVHGAVAGSFPIDGAYGRYEYLNWAAKFYIDAELISMRVAEPEPRPVRIGA